MLDIMIAFGVPFALFGIGYPLMNLVMYPVYRMLGGRKSLRRFLKDM